jgi:MFS family permease
MSLMPLIAKELIAGGPLTYGALLGAFGIGAVAGGILTAYLRKVWSTEAIVRSASIGFGIAAAGAALSSNLPLTMIALSIAGAGWVLALATFNVAVQLSAPRWVLARAMSIYQMATFGGLAAGSWTWGVIATELGLQTTLLLAAVVILFGALLGRWFRLAKTEAINLDPLRLWREPATAVPVQPTTGPVVVMVEYLIDADDVLAFLGAMAELRRIRRRDGALNWRLLRDLADAQIWTERYETPTWSDYIRLTNRLTQDDALIRETLRSLHRGKEAPRVRRMIERQTSLPVRGAAGSTELTET